MNQKKVKKQINKINTFYDSITADDEVSKIEKDLLLSYVRKLYETIVDSDSSTKSTKSPSAKKEVKIKTVTTPAVKKVVVVQEVIDTPPAVERKPFEKTVPKVDATVVLEPSKVTSVQKVAQSVTASAPVAEVMDTPAFDISENMSTIFDQASGNEISDRLSNLPIKDLTKSMGINERMFTVKELFAGDTNKFNSVLNDLNGFSNFDEAKSYLIDGIATELQWDDASTFKKATTFVKLVQRRYS